MTNQTYLIKLNSLIIKLYAATRSPNSQTRELAKNHLVELRLKRAKLRLLIKQAEWQGSPLLDL